MFPGRSERRTNAAAVQSSRTAASLRSDFTSKSAPIGQGRSGGALAGPRRRKTMSRTRDNEVSKGKRERPLDEGERVLEQLNALLQKLDAVTSALDRVEGRLARVEGRVAVPD